MEVTTIDFPLLEPLDPKSRKREITSLAVLVDVRLLVVDVWRGRVKYLLGYSLGTWTGSGRAS